MRNPGVQFGNYSGSDDSRPIRKHRFHAASRRRDQRSRRNGARAVGRAAGALISEEAPVDLPPFYIDRFEVTNREFKEFIDAGGYARAELWRDLPFGDDVAGWQEAVARFVDATGRPGPATWEAGTYPDGTGDHPVAGVSWFEAVAYARFRGKELPTAYHWYRAAYSLNERLESLASVDHRCKQLRWARHCAGGPAPGHRPVRHLRHGRQRPRMAVERVTRRTLDRGRRMEPGAVPLQRARRGAGLGPFARKRLSLHAHAARPGLCRATTRADRAEVGRLRGARAGRGRCLRGARAAARILIGGPGSAVSSPWSSTNPLWTRERITLATAYDDTRFAAAACSCRPAARRPTRR